MGILMDYFQPAHNSWVVWSPKYPKQLQRFFIAQIDIQQKNQRSSSTNLKMNQGLTDQKKNKLVGGFNPFEKY